MPHYHQCPVMRTRHVNVGKYLPCIGIDHRQHTRVREIVPSLKHRLQRVRVLSVAAAITTSTQMKPIVKTLTNVHLNNKKESRNPHYWPTVADEGFSADA
jgi:hypothetical protein